MSCDPVKGGGPARSSTRYGTWTALRVVCAALFGMDTWSGGRRSACDG